ncbi:MAG: NAD(P)-dependent oxidoreductase [Patescibacteria group bacterium]
MARPSRKKRVFNTVLVTGGAGYVGTSLVPLLLSNGYTVRVLDSLRLGGVGLLPVLAHPNLEFIRGDVRNRADVAKAMRGVDAVIHLAAIVGAPACQKDPKLSYDTNVNGTKILVEAAGRKIPVVFASTGSNYGKMKEAICTETTPLNPLSHYGRQKTKAEEIVKKNKEYVIFRFATAFGISPRMRLDLMPNDFTYRAVRDRSLIVYEKHFMRTFIHVRDMARAFLFALEQYKKMQGEIYNVGDDSLNFTKEEVCLMIKKKTDYFLHFADVGKDIDQRDYLVSYKKLGSLGYKTTVSMEQGIDELIRAAHLIDVQNPHYNA